MLSNEDVIEALKILDRYRSLKISADAALKMLIQHSAEGGSLPSIPQHGISAPIQYECVVRTSPQRIWRSESKVKEVLAALKFDVEKFMEPAALKSPAQIEKIVDRQYLEGLWIHPSRGVDILPEGSGFEKAQFAS